MDYKIKFEYKGSEQKANSTRQKIIQAQKQAGKTEVGKPAIDQQLTKSITSLNASIKDLISANKSLALSFNKGGGGGGGIPKTSSLPGGGGGIGGIGASIPIIGAAIGLAGFAIQKINQVGNAYIDKVSAQKGTVGIGGFQGPGATGMYLSEEKGQYAKAYRMAGGKFGGNVPVGGSSYTYNENLKKWIEKNEKVSTPMQLGTIFGLSPEEIGRQAGTFGRAGISYQQQLYTGAGAGIQTELPSFMQAISSTLEEAITNGVNASSLSQDIGKEMSSLVRSSATQSVTGVVNMLKSFQGVQQQVAKGQIGTYEGLLTYKTAGKIAEKNIGDENFQKQLIERGIVGKEEIAGLKKQVGGKKLTMKDFAKLGVDIEPMITQMIAEDPTLTAKIMKETIQSQIEMFGGGTSGARKAYGVYRSTGGTLGMTQYMTVAKTGKMPEDIEKKGEKVITDKYQQTSTSAALLGVQKQAMRDTLVMGGIASEFAKITISMNQSMINLANTATPLVTNGFNVLSQSVNRLNGFINDLSNLISDAKGGNVSSGIKAYGKAVGAPVLLIKSGLDALGQKIFGGNSK